MRPGQRPSRILVLSLMLIGLSHGSISPDPASRARFAPAGRVLETISLRPGLDRDEHLTAQPPQNVQHALAMYLELTGRRPRPTLNDLVQTLDGLTNGRLSRWHLLRNKTPHETGIVYHRDGLLTAEELKKSLETFFQNSGVIVAADGPNHLWVMSRSSR